LALRFVSSAHGSNVRAGCGSAARQRSAAGDAHSCCAARLCCQAQLTRCGGLWGAWGAAVDFLQVGLLGARLFLLDPMGTTRSMPS
jgi:hypothetical protein